MKKKAKISLKTAEEVIQYDILIELKNNKINYQEPDSLKTNVLLDLNTKVLLRDNKDIYLEYRFLNNDGDIYVKDLNKNIHLNLTDVKLEERNTYIKIQYKIDNKEYMYDIDME